MVFRKSSSTIHAIYREVNWKFSGDFGLFLPMESRCEQNDVWMEVFTTTPATTNPTVGEGFTTPKLGSMPQSEVLSVQPFHPIGSTEVMGVSCDEFPKLKDGPSLGMKELKDLAVLHRVNRVDTSPSSIRDC